MFNRDSILYQVNVISKMIGIILVILSLIFFKIPGFLVLISVILLILSYNFKYTFIYSIINLIIVIISSFYTPILWLSKLLIFINYLIIIKKVTSDTDLRYVLEVTLYKFNNKKITYHILYCIYFFKYIKKNYNLLVKLGEEYGIKKDWFYRRFSLRKSYQKSKQEMQELMVINSLRFYNYSSTRTYIEKPTWERWDSGYVIFHLILLLFAIIYGGILWDIK